MSQQLINHHHQNGSNIKQVLYLGLDPTHYKEEGQLTHCPLIQIHPRSLEEPAIGQALQHFSSYTHVLITSKSTIPVLLDFLAHFGYTVQDWAKKMTLAIGQVTAHHLSAQGIHSYRIAQEETAEGLVKELSSLPLQDAHVFWPHSAQSRSIISDFFHRHQFSLRECIVYETRFLYPHPLPDLNQFDEIVFTSPSTVEAFLHVFKRFPIHPRLTPIGPVTAACLSSHKEMQDNNVCRPTV